MTPIEYAISVLLAACVLSTSLNAAQAVFTSNWAAFWNRSWLQLVLMLPLAVAFGLSISGVR